MISRKDKLLIKPWQQKRYENHRRKVQSALPAIDNRSPPLRQHVDLNLKKQQKENERCAKIEKENLLLLRRLGYIMRTNRVDNSWITPPPNFLNRVAVAPQTAKYYKSESLRSSFEEAPKVSNRKSRCEACTPKAKKTDIDEERVPWEPDKIPASQKLRSKSVPAKRSTLPVINEKANHSAEKEKMRERQQSGFIKERKRIDLDESAQSIIISRGALKLSVNFPPDSSITFRNGSSRKLLMRDCCNCKIVATAAC